MLLQVAVVFQPGNWLNFTAELRYYFVCKILFKCKLVVEMWV